MARHYWPCSHGFNRDPEIQELRRTYADWMGYVWQEMCSIGDMNDGVIKGTPEEIGVSLAYVSLTKRPSLSAKCITNALGFMHKRGWIELQTDRVLIVNHAKYHAYQINRTLPPNLPTNHTNKHIPPKPPKGGEVFDLSFQRFWDIYPKKVARKAAIKAWQKEAALRTEVQDKIMDTLPLHKQQSSWLRDSGQYIPNAATWLNGRRWEDEVELSRNGDHRGKRVIEPKGFETIRQILKEENQS